MKTLSITLAIISLAMSILHAADVIGNSLIHMGHDISGWEEPDGGSGEGE